MEVRLALSIGRNRQRQDHSDGYAQPHAHSNEDFDPRIEWREGPSSYTLLVYVPGFKKEDLMVEIDDTRTVTISGQRRFEEMVMVGWTWHRLERRGQSFRKQLRIPANVNTDAVAGRFVPGILYIIMPKLPSNTEGGISNCSLEKPPEADGPPTSPRPDPESSDTEMPVGIRIDDVSLQPEEAPSPDTDDPSHQILAIPVVLAPADESPGRGRSEDQVPYQVEYPEEEIHPPSVSTKDSDEDIPATPPGLPEAADQPLGIQSLPEADENMPTAEEDIPSPSPDHHVPPCEQIQEHPQGPVASTPPRTPQEREPPTELQHHPPSSPPGTPPQTPKGQQPPTQPQHHPPQSPPGTPPQTPKEQQPPTQLEHRPPHTPPGAPPQTPKGLQSPTQLEHHPPHTPPGTPPQTPKEPQSPSELHHQPEQESRDSSKEEPSPPQVPPNPVESPAQAEELEKQAEDTGTDATKQEDASPASDSEPSGHMQPSIPPVEEHAKDEGEEVKIEESEEEEDGVKQAEQPWPDKQGCRCKKYAMLSVFAVAVVAFIAHQVRCKR